MRLDTLLPLSAAIIIKVIAFSILLLTKLNIIYSILVVRLVAGMVGFMSKILIYPSLSVYLFLVVYEQLCHVVY